jgi:hypothetical protein
VYSKLMSLSVRLAVTGSSQLPYHQLERQGVGQQSRFCNLEELHTSSRTEYVTASARQSPSWSRNSMYLLSGPSRGLCRSVMLPNMHMNPFRTTYGHLTCMHDSSAGESSSRTADHSSRLQAADAPWWRMHAHVSPQISLMFLSDSTRPPALLKLPRNFLKQGTPTEQPVVACHIILLQAGPLCLTDMSTASSSAYKRLFPRMYCTHCPGDRNQALLC